MKNKVKTEHERIFKCQAQTTYFSPGRVNLIGEHTDYSGGYAMPMAIHLGTYASVSKRDDGDIHVYSDFFVREGVRIIDLDNLEYNEKLSFTKYIQGMIAILIKNGYKINQGLNINITSDLPAGAGLSSSASLEVLIGLIMDDFNHLSIPKKDLATLAQKVENDYLGLSTGIMDQYSIVFGKKGHAVFLDTEILEHEYVPVDFSDYILVLMNTNKHRSLVESNYNERSISVGKGVSMIREKTGIHSIKKVSPELFESIIDDSFDETVVKRIGHVIYENERTLKAKEALNNRDYAQFGSLMNGSHDSLRDLLEVSCDESNFLVEENLKLGAVGSRMMGGGFGGTMIALYKKEDYPKSFDTLIKKYKKAYNKRLDIYLAIASNGPRKVAN